jgi:SAM-dependent methyltransferase
MTKSPVILKLTHPSDINLIKKAEWFSRQPGIEVFTDLPNLPILQITRKGIFLETNEVRFSFHPSMALIRLIQLSRGEPDRFLKATGLKPGDTFLDATLGLGTDALVAAQQVGDGGHVIGIEHSPLLAALIQEGLSTMVEGPLPRVENPDKANAWLALSQAARRIEVQWGDHLRILKQYPASSVDVIYFDPMFRHTREQSASIRPLHHFSNTQPLQKEAILEACRVAKKRVVLKERKGSSEFSRLGFTIHEGGKYSNVDYGIIEEV